jgi:acyl-[acyl-carrier-protein] desaturase
VPGVGVQGFTRRALQVARAGSGELRSHHDEVLGPLLRSWELFGVRGLRPEAEQARDRPAAHLAKANRLVGRFEANPAATATANQSSAVG